MKHPVQELLFLSVSLLPQLGLLLQGLTNVQKLIRQLPIKAW